MIKYASYPEMKASKHNVILIAQICIGSDRILTMAEDIQLRAIVLHDSHRADDHTFWIIAFGRPTVSTQKRFICDAEFSPIFTVMIAARGFREESITKTDWLAEPEKTAGSKFQDLAL
jgi:hypothetical protein